MSATVFIIVYAGMVFGRIPRLRVDRTGMALLGAIALMAAGVVSPAGAVNSMDMPTMALLFGLMVLSAQLRLGGFYTAVARRLSTVEVEPRLLLLMVVFMTGALSAVFTNDIICLAVTPVLIEITRNRGLDPVPFLLALPCAANVGSAATLIGNPQNILIGQALSLSFPGYLLAAIGPTLVGLGIVWGVIAFQTRGRWTRIVDHAKQNLDLPAFPSFDRWETGKGLAGAGFLLGAFLFTSLPRDVAALTVAGVFLLSRKLHSRQMLGLVDWQLLVLFFGLFVVNHAFQATGIPEGAVESLVRHGVDLTGYGWFFFMTVTLSNLVSNVPAVMLLLPLAVQPLSGPLMALVSTLAGNLIVVGSVANIIVVEMAGRQGLEISWGRHARTGVPVTIFTLTTAVVGLWLYSWVLT